MLHIVESTRSVAEIEERFPKVTAAHKFGVLGQHDLRRKLKEKGIPFDRECTVFEICSPLNAKAVLEADMAISTALPCRVSVYSEGGLTKIATLSPTRLLRVFGHPELAPAAAEVEKTIYAIMDELR